MPDKKHYLLASSAEADLQKAKQRSQARWGRELTREYFIDLDNAAEYVATHHEILCYREDLTGDTDLFIHPVREHYLIYLPIGKHYIIIVAVLRQSRNIPEILAKSVFMIHRKVEEIKGLLKVGKLKLP